MALSEGMKKLFAEEKNWEGEGVYDGPATLDDIFTAFHSFSEDEIVETAGGSATFEELEDELSRLRQKYGKKAKLGEVEQGEQ